MATLAACAGGTGSLQEPPQGARGQATTHAPEETGSAPITDAGAPDTGNDGMDAGGPEAGPAWHEPLSDSGHDDASHSHDAGNPSSEQDGGALLDAGDGAVNWSGELVASQGASVAYTLEWSWEDATWDAASERYIVALDGGARVEVASLAIASTSFELIACEHEHDAGTLSALGRWWDALSPFGVSVARANHTGYTEGPSYARAPVAQQVVGAVPLAFAEASLDEAHYCELHQVLEPIDADGLLEFQTLSLSAVWFAAEDAAGQPIDVTVTLPMASLPALQVSPSVAGGDVEVVITRQVGRALRAIDWTQTGVDLAYDALFELARATQVYVQPRA